MGDAVVEHGDLVQRHDGRSNVHIVCVAGDPCVVTVCGRSWPRELLRHVDADRPKQCSTCWETM